MTFTVDLQAGASLTHPAVLGSAFVMQCNTAAQIKATAMNLIARGFFLELWQRGVSSNFSVRYDGKKTHFRAPRIEPRVLHDDWHIGFEDG
jgi:hypothetical protein